MNNIVKYIYCVSTKNNIGVGKSIQLYARFTGIWDQRALSSGSYTHFNVADSDISNQLLYYLENKEKCIDKARTRLDLISEQYGLDKVV